MKMKTSRAVILTIIAVLLAIYILFTFERHQPIEHCDTPILYICSCWEHAANISTSNRGIDIFFILRSVIGQLFAAKITKKTDNPTLCNKNHIKVCFVPGKKTPRSSIRSLGVYEEVPIR